MEWRKPPEEHVALLHELVPNGPAPIEYRQMFGSPCYWTSGNMFAFVHQDDVVVRLSESDREELLAVPGSHLFEPMEGRPMREYVALPPEMLADPDTVRGWFERGLAYAATLPPKEKKRRRKA